MRAISVCLAILSFVVALPAVGQVQPATLEAVDSVGTVIGPVTSDNVNTVTASLLVDSHTIRALVTKSFIAGITGSPVVFTSSDCSGQGYVAWGGNIGEPSAIVGSTDSVYAGPAGAPQTISYNSLIGAGGSCQTFSNTESGMLPVSFVRDLSLQPPFSVRASATASASSAVPAVSFVGLALLTVALVVAGARALRPSS